MINSPNQTWAKWASSFSLPHVNVGGAWERSLSLFLLGNSFFCILHSRVLSNFFQWQDCRYDPDIMRKEVTLPPAGHKQKGLSSFWLITRGHISPSQTEIVKECRTERERKSGLPFFD